MSDEYSPADDGPEANLYRQDAAAEARQREQHERDERVINHLLSTLRPYDGVRALLTWDFIKRWGQRRAI